MESNDMVWNEPEGKFATTSWPGGRQGSALCAAGDKLILFGGRCAGKGRTYTNDMWVRECAPGSSVGELWREVHSNADPNLWPCPRHNHTICTVKGGSHLLLFGGATHGELKGKRFAQIYLDDVWLFDVAENVWVRQNATTQVSPPGRHCHTLTQCRLNGVEYLLLFGGFSKNSYCNDSWLLNVDAMEWVPLSVGGDIPSPRSQHCGVVVGDSHFVMFGGYFYDERSRKEVYNNETFVLKLENDCKEARGVWTRVHAANAPSRRNRSSMFVFNDVIYLVNGNFYDNKRGSDIWFQDCHSLHNVIDGIHPHWKLPMILGKQSHFPSQSHMSCAVKEGVGVFFFGGEIRKSREQTLHLLQMK
jgi:hypothetical protein